MQGHSAPPATSTTHQLAAQPRKVRLSFRKRSTDVEKAGQHDLRFAKVIFIQKLNAFFNFRGYVDWLVIYFSGNRAYGAGSRLGDGMAAAWDIIASMLGGPAPPASPAPLPHEVAAAAAPLRSPLPWMQFMPAPGAPMPAPPEAQRLRSPAADPEPDRDESAPAAKKNRAGVELGGLEPKSPP